MWRFVYEPIYLLVGVGRDVVEVLLCIALVTSKEPKIDMRV